MDLSDPARVLMPTGTAAVIRALAGADAAFSVREVARIAEVSHGRAHQVVQHLARHGLVSTEAAGGALLCRLNRDHLAAQAAVEIAQLRSRLLDLLRREIADWRVPAEHASLFGSAARGDGTTESDLDILVVRPAKVADDDEVWAGQLASTGRRVLAATGNPAAWFVLDRAELRAAIRRDEAIVEQWRQTAIRLAGDPFNSVAKRAA